MNSDSLVSPLRRRACGPEGKCAAAQGAAAGSPRDGERKHARQRAPGSARRGEDLRTDHVGSLWPQRRRCVARVDSNRRAAPDPNKIRE